MASSRMTRVLVGTGCWLSTVCIAACSLVLGTDGQQCETTADCTNRGPTFAATVCVQKVCVDDAGAAGGAGGAAGAQAGGAGGDSAGAAGSAGSVPEDPRWACLGSVKAPPSATVPLDVAVSVRNDQSLPIDYVDARVCTNLDVNCLSPYLSGLKTDSGGKITFQVPPNFVGYIELTDARYATGAGGASGAGGAGGAGGDGTAGTGGAGGNPSQKLVPVLLVVDAVSGNLPIESEPVTMVSYGVVNVLASLFGQTFDPTRATALIAMYDCEGKRAPGVSLEVDATAAYPETIVFYTVGPAPGVPDPTVGFSDANGTGGILNMKPRANAVVTARRFAGSTRVGSATFPTRAGWMTNLNVIPTP